MIPTKREDLVSMGWVFDNEAHCRGCGEPVEWWITPKGKKMPMTVKEVRDRDSPISPIKEIQRIPHWATCERADSFRSSH